MVGKALAQYQISEKLGEGGMGVVWKARDTRLDRFVALKTLLAEKLGDPERKRRFAQEAKSASALNHPNIVHIYDIADADGTQFIAMEYVPGKTLEQLIGRKGLRLNEALKYAVQIADALAKAHSAGIVHRDLKPSNIMVTEDGLVKVLDFGLAKLAETPIGEFGETATATEPKSPRTEEGKIVGTTAYMSPEQAEGKKVDARSDIFSFGSVLYEMVTGQPAFHGESRLSTLSAILKDDPKPLNSILPDVPRDLEKIISQCLRKNPERRFQHMDDLKVALLDLKEESDSGKLSSAVSGSVPGRRRAWLPWIFASSIVLLLVPIGLRLLRPTPRSTPRIVPLTSYPGRQITPAVSPDGKQVAFAWDGENRDNFDIYVKLVGTGAPLRLTNNPAYEDSPAWSPDGGYIAFFRRLPDHDEIWTIPALGGAERKTGESWSGGELGGVRDSVGGYWWWGQLSWSPDGKFVALPSKNAAQTAYSIFLLSVETGDKRKLTSPPNEYISDSAPRFSPDGKNIAFVRGSSPLSSELYVLSLVDGNPSGVTRRLTFDEREIFGLDWTPDSRRLVYSSGHFNNTSLWTIFASGGVPERFSAAGENVIGLSVSRSGGRLVYERDAFDFNIWRVPGPNSSDRKGEPSRFIASTQEDLEPQFSPDGTKIAFISSRSGNQEIWVCDRDGHNPVQLTALDGSPVGSPRWSPDSRWIAFDSPKAGNSDVYVISSERGPPRRLTRGPANHTRPSWSRDGRWIYFGSDRNRNWQKIWKVPAQGGAAVQVAGAKGEEAFESADGKFVYYAKSNAPGIWRVPVGGGEETRILDQARQSLWALTDQGVCFFDLGNLARPALKFYSLATGKLRVLREFSRETRLDTFSTAISVSPDGRWILYTQLDQSGSDLMLVDNYR